jgi:energy-coupling factor transporter ATP-binding protein EcfA2
MKTKSIILRGGYASGKTLLAETIAGVLEPSKVLKIDPNKTVIGMLREVLFSTKTEFDLIIFDGCFDIKHIKMIDKRIIQYLFQKHQITSKTVVYTTQDFSFKNVLNFKLIECTFKN